MQEENFYFTWLSLIDVDIYTFIKLIRSLGDVKELFYLTSSSNKFYNYLVQNNIFISKDLYQKFIDFKIKQRAKILFKSLIQDDFKIIHIFSREYNQIIKSYNNLPVVFFVKGNMDLLYKEKVYLYLESIDNISKVIKSSLECSIINKDYTLIQDDSNNSNISNKIIISDIKNIENSLKNKQNKDVLNIFVNLNKNDDISCFIDKLIIINASYKKDIVYLVDSMLEQGKDVYVVPNNILNKSAYFSNYLISEGAKVVINLNNPFL